MSNDADAYVRSLHEALTTLQKDYAKAAEPYLKRLVEIQSLKQPQYMVTREQAIALGLIEPGPNQTKGGK